jgi:methionine synthase II (cobalamin-independent)
MLTISTEEYLRDLGAIYREEIRDLYEAGCRNIQLDDPWLLQLGYTPIRDDIYAAGEDPERLFGLMKFLLLECLRDRPKDMTIGIHMCRGNMQGKNFIGGEYNWIAERCDNESTTLIMTTLTPMTRLFRDLPVDCFYVCFLSGIVIRP